MTPGTPHPVPESDRRLRHNARLARLLTFLQLILGRGRWNPKSLMEELEVSERTIHRMRETLELAGVPLWYSKELNAYQVRPDFRFPVLHLTDDEAIGQGTATAITESPAVHFGNGAKATTRKLINSAPEKTKAILEDAARLTEVLDLKIAGDSRQRETLRTIQWALLQRRILSGKYASPYEPGSVTLTLHPCRLALIKQAWYLIARPDKEESPRTFRAVRFQSLKMIDRPATIPDEFDIKTYLGNAWAVYRGEESYDIELKFSSTVASIVTETTWHPTQKVEKHKDGVVTLRFKIDGLNEIVRWIVGYAGEVEVIAPDELRKLVLDRHKRAAILLEKN